MYFQINVTPESRKVSKIFEQEPESSAILILGPFQPQTRLTLESIVNSKVSTDLTLRNPSNRSLNLKITKRPPVERSIILSDSDLTIHPNNDTILSVSWTPTEKGSWRDTLQFTDSRRIKYDVVLTLTCRDIKNAQTKVPSRNRMLKQHDESRKTSDRPKKILNLNYNDNKENVTNNVTNTMKFDCKHESPKSFYMTESKTSTVNNLDISHFQLTPVNPYRNIQSCSETTEIYSTNVFERQVLNATEVDFIASDASIISPRNIVEGPTLRRETYLNPEPKFFKQMISIDETENENFDDSLSPPPTQFHELTTENKAQVNSSKILNEIDNFTMPIVSMQSAACSTEYNSDPENQQVLTTDALSFGVMNRTFDITVNSERTTLNNIWSANKSPNSIHESRQIRPTRLSEIFAKMSSNTTTLDVPKISLTSSPKSTCNQQRISSQSNDPTSAKAILEADLWAKDDNLHASSSNLNKKKCDDVFKGIVETSLKNTQKYVSTLRKSSGFCFEISPTPKDTKTTRRIGGTMKKPSPLKPNKAIKRISVTQNNLISRKKIREPKTQAKQRNTLTIPSVRITKLSLNHLKDSSVANKSTATTSTIVTTTLTKNNIIKAPNQNCVISSIRNRDPFAVTMTEDPFLTHSLFYDDHWINYQELEFKKWLNALLTPPEHSADVETANIDVGKVWQSCRAKDNVTLAETKETVSARYNTHTRLDTLRKAACVMYTRDQVKNILAQAIGCVEKGIFVIRQDRDLHRDIGLQKAILELLLSYNPLWLRIGLEVVYGETIPLNSNNDLIGLTRFLIARFFSDPYLVQTYSHANVVSLKLPAFQSHMNKFLLKKFILIVYFLDYAKRNKLIGHDPCLFHKKAIYKDSRSILLTFSREVLSGVGDITKILRTVGYIVSHKQTYLDEYNYAVKDISSDLRDGVRLCRVMELIIGDRTLTSQCRVPSISRLQKIHNVDLALKALFRVGYQITGGIDAKSIVDGHREKTLSLLWQIIYKFQRPRFEKSAIILQKWWRAMLWYVRVKNYLSQRHNNAVCVIQRSWRCYRAKKLTLQMREAHVHRMKIMEESVRIIQLRWIHRKKMLHDRYNFMQMKTAAIRIQKWFRRIRVCRPYLQDLQKKRQAVIILQRHLRTTITMRRERMAFKNTKQATVIIQRWWRATSLKCSIQNYYQKLRATTIFIQSKWRAQQQMKIQSNCYLKMREAIIKIQTWWRSSVITKRIRNNFILERNAARVIESWWININATRNDREKFLLIRNSTIIIQRNFKNYQATKNYVLSFNSHRKAIKIIQTWWRSVKHAREYRLKRNSVISIQRWWRGLIISRNAASTFFKMKKAAINIQKTWKMKQTRRKYLKIKNAASTIQTWYRNTRKMQTIHRDFIKKKNAVIQIQSWWRELKITHECQQKYAMYRQAVILIQTRWREKMIAKSTRQEYLNLKIATIKIQKYWRMIRARRTYLYTLKRHKAALLLQRRWKARNIGRATRHSFVILRNAVITIQNRYRMLCVSRHIRNEYLVTYQAILRIQRSFRAMRMMQQCRKQYLEFRNAVIRIQSTWRMIKVRREYRSKLNAALIIQIHWRRTLSSRIIRDQFLTLKKSVIFIQRRYRLEKIAMKTQQDYNKLRNTVIWVQRKWRMKQLGREKNNFVEKQKLNNAATIIQAVWRGYKTRMLQSVEIQELRSRSRKAAETATPSTTVEHRLQIAMDLLQNFTNIGQLSMCLACVDTLTRFSPKGCILFCELNLVEKLYSILEKSNRSLPWMDVCRRCTNILITLIKLPETASHVRNIAETENVVRLMNIAFKQDKDLFLHLATFFWLLLNDEEFALQVTETKSTIWLIKSLIKMATKKDTTILMKNKNTSMVLQPMLPNLKSDWGLKTRRPRCFITIHQAISTLMEKLGITSLS